MPSGSDERGKMPAKQAEACGRKRVEATCGVAPTGVIQRALRDAVNGLFAMSFVCVHNAP